MHKFAIYLLAAMIIAGPPSAADAREEKGYVPPPPERTNKIRALIVTGGHDFDRKTFFDIFNGHPDIEWKDAVQPEAQKWFAPEKADEYDVMVWYDMYQKIDEAGKQNLVALLNKGKPLVVLHHAIADYQGWPEAIKIIGGRFHLKPHGDHPQSTFQHDVRFRIKPADPAHPLTRFMRDFDLLDEVYGKLQVLPDVRPLLTTDHPASDKLIGWTHSYGKSPVVYVQMGHGPSAFNDGNYRRLIVQSIRWAAGRLPDGSEEGFVSLFNGKDLDGWTVLGRREAYEVRDGVLHSDSGKDGQWIRTNREYGDFILRLDWRTSTNGNAGVFIRAEKDGYPWITGSEIQISNEARNDIHCTGSLYGTVAVDPRPDESADMWHGLEIQCHGPRIKVFADHLPIIDVDRRVVPALQSRPSRGYIGLQDSHNLTGWIEYRNVRVKELAPPPAEPPIWRLAVQSYTFNRFSFFESVEKVKSLGLRHIEGFGWQKLGSEFGDIQINHKAPPEVLARVRQKLSESGVRLTHYYFAGDGKDEDEMRKTFDFARSMGIQVLVGEPDPETLPFLDRLTADYDVNLAIHDHAKPSKYWDPQFLADTIKHRSRRIGACADVGHWQRSGLDPVESLKKLEGRIISLHFKDITKSALDGQDTIWGTGIGNAKGMLAELKRQNFSGVISVEYEHNMQDNYADVAACVKFFKQSAGELGVPGPY